MTALLDTSFLLAAAFERDRNHKSAATALRALKGERFVVSPVVVELFFMAATRISYDQAIRLFSLLQSPAFTIVNLTAEDRTRMTTLMRQYRDAELDIADVAQIAVAERLNVATIYSFDRRDFALVRPRHMTHFNVLP